MIAQLLLIALAVCCLHLSPAQAQRWESRGKDFVLRAGREEITFSAPGTLTAGLPNGPRVGLGLFLWHGSWVYESLGAGKADGPATLDERGWLRQSGTWVVREGAPPMRYTLALEPTPTGAVLHLETEKTAPLKLTAGLWASLSLERKRFTAQQRIHAWPAGRARIGRSVSGSCESLIVELENGRAVSFAPESQSELRSRVNDATHGFEMNLRRGDFPVGEKARASLKIAFGAMPEEFPGEILPSSAPLSLGRVTANTPRVPRYGKLELTVDLRGTWENPFDPDQVRLDAQVTTASGRQYTQPGFFLVDHRREVRGGAELFYPQGSGRWCVRLAATEPGPLRVKLTARDRSGTVSKDAGTFTVLPGAAKGFIRTSRVDPRYLQHDNGEGFVPIGHNLPSYHTAGQIAPEAIRKMAANGENYNRWWISSGSNLGLEWEERLGWYRQIPAARLDAILDLAAELGFTYMLCMDTHQDFRGAGWQANPFNQINGGPCATPKDWFTNEQARARYKKRLRYTVARWGYSPNVLAWEFGNEFEGWADTPEATIIAWHREMASTLAALDPYRHLITTSWWGKTGPEACWQIPEIDIVQTHCYTNNDGNVAEQVRDYCLHQWRKFTKPHIFGEFGIRSHESTADKDPKGWNLHNANWSAVMSGCCGIPMPWWHENYIEPQDLYFHFNAIANFTRGLPFGSARWEQVTARAPEYLRPPSQVTIRDLVLATAGKWARPEVAEFTVRPDGTVNDPGSLLDLLHGEGHKELQNPPTFVVNYPEPGKFTVSVGRVSNSGLLRVWVDGQLKLEREFPCGEGHGKQWVHRPQWNLWESSYDEDVSVDIPAGPHRIKMENLGKDWMRVNRYVFTGCKVVDRPDLLVAALRTSRWDFPGATAIVWIQNRESDWHNHQRGTVKPVAPARIALEGFPDGAYTVEWWETWRGKPTRTERVVARGGVLTLQTAELETDIAAKIRRAP